MQGTPSAQVPPLALEPPEEQIRQPGQGVYVTDIQEDWGEISEDDHGPKNVEVKIPEMDITKYNDKIQMLEELRRDALKDLKIMEDELGMHDSSYLESVDAKAPSK